MKITDDFLAKRTSEIINNSCSASFDLLRQEAERQRKQLYDLAHPEKQLLKQLSSIGMAAACTDSVFQETINRKAANTVNALNVNPMVAHVNSVLEETINQNAANALGMNTAAAHADSVLQEAMRLNAMVAVDYGATAAAAQTNFVLQEQEAMARKAMDVIPIYSRAEALAQINSISFASEAAKLSRNSVADIEKRLFLNSAAELERQLFPFQDYSRNNSSFYLPSDSFVIRSSPKTSRQEERLTESKRRAEAENTHIIIPGQRDYLLTLLAAATDTAIKAGLQPPATIEDIEVLLANINQMLEDQKPQDAKPKAIPNLMSELGKAGAEKRHSQPGGSRDNAEKIRKIWATGKYNSRDICAEQECAALNISFSTARKHLRNTPNPHQ